MFSNVPDLIVWGVLDSLAPLHVGVLALFLASCLSLSKDRKALLVFSFVFLLCFYTLNLMFLTGFLNSLLLTKWYPIISKVICFLLGIWLSWMGGHLFLLWNKLIRDHSSISLNITELHFFPKVRSLKAPIAIFMAMLLSFALAIWPPSTFIGYLAISLMSPGKWFEVVSGMALYSFFKIIFLLIATVVVYIYSRGWIRADKSILNSSMICIIMAAFYLAVGLGIIFVSLTQI